MANRNYGPYPQDWGGNPNPNFGNNWAGVPYQRPNKKHSGAKSGQGKNGKFYVTAWNYSKQRGLIAVKAFENSKSVRSESPNTGNRFITMMFEVFYKKTGAKVLEIASFNVNTGKVYLQKLGMVISTKAPNGGYFGQIKTR